MCPVRSVISRNYIFSMKIAITIRNLIFLTFYIGNPIESHMWGSPSRICIFVDFFEISSMWWSSPHQRWCHNSKTKDFPLGELTWVKLQMVFSKNQQKNLKSTEGLLSCPVFLYDPLESKSPDCRPPSDSLLLTAALLEFLNQRGRPSALPCQPAYPSYLDIWTGVGYSAWISSWMLLRYFMLEI